jgi:hypothetical protein
MQCRVARVSVGYTQTITLTDSRAKASATQWRATRTLSLKVESSNASTEDATVVITKRAGFPD